MVCTWAVIARQDQQSRLPQPKFFRCLARVLRRASLRESVVVLCLTRKKVDQFCIFAVAESFNL